MPGRTDSVRPAIAAAALLVVAAVALRGHVPGAPDASREPPADDPLSTVLVVAMLVIAVGVVLTAVIVRARQRTAGRAAPADRPDWLRAEIGRPSWRALLIAFAALAIATSAALLIGGIGSGTEPDSSAGGVPARATTTKAPGDGRVPRADAPHGDVIGYLAAATGVFLVVLVVGSVAAMQRRGSAVTSAGEDAAPASDPEKGAETLARAAEVALAEVEDPGRDPRTAIIACYVAMERELARVPEAVPQEWDTASEVLARAVDNHALGPDSATLLVDLFDEARFSPHVMNEGHRDAAAGALQRVLDELRVRT